MPSQQTSTTDKAGTEATNTEATGEQNSLFAMGNPFFAAFNWFNMFNPLSDDSTGKHSDQPFISDIPEKYIAARENQAKLLTQATSGNAKTIISHINEQMNETAASTNAITAAFAHYSSPLALMHAFDEYRKDALARWCITADILRKRGDNFIEHQDAECPPVLTFDYKVILDGKEQKNHPCNYQLLKIKPPRGTKVDPGKRPYVIIDPRAGHGAGIGGFKPDSQVGVAFKAGHAVYFISFTRTPVVGQTIADITKTEAKFIRHIEKNHPKAPKPVIVGNCQGGWATLLLAATNPKITGPLVLSGAPVSTWEGTPGGNPMRYNAGVLGGTWMPMMLADMGNGVFDGAFLVSNFEQLNPARNYVGKFTDLYQNPLKGEQRFLDFERWWNGFFLLNEAEIRWIVEQLFIGNKLSRNEATLDGGAPVDLKNIVAPLIIFASWGDNITPPEQALTWVLETYANENELKILGRKIIYRVHESTGHLGIFVSAKIANKEHTEFTETLEIIEALPPGLYEMQIETGQNKSGEPKFEVDFTERNFDDLRLVCGTSEDRPAFAAVERSSEMQAHLYETTLRPFIQATSTPAMAELSRELNPMRTSRAGWSSLNPLAKFVEKQADIYRNMDAQDLSSNPFVLSERLWTQGTINSLDLMRDYRDMFYEQSFFSLWASPMAELFGAPYSEYREKTKPEDLSKDPAVIAAIAQADHGSFEEAIIRILLMIADANDMVEREHMNRMIALICNEAPDLLDDRDKVAETIKTQTLITTYARPQAIAALPTMITTSVQRQLTLNTVVYVTGPLSEYKPQAQEILHEICQALQLEYPDSDASESAANKTTIAASSNQAP